MLQGAVLTRTASNTAEDSVDEIDDIPINGTFEVDSDADDPRNAAGDASGVVGDTPAVGGVSIADASARTWARPTRRNDTWSRIRVYGSGSCKSNVDAFNATAMKTSFESQAKSTFQSLKSLKKHINGETSTGRSPCFRILRLSNSMDSTEENRHVKEMKKIRA
ncbi:hypothetical protein EDD21DRAFT_413130 [Dissophora ornata]|nr:hypothetical protein EDD21DRAFT_413130 [Dissophora ornata]